MSKSWISLSGIFWFPQNSTHPPSLFFISAQLTKPHHSTTSPTYTLLDTCFFLLLVPKPTSPAPLTLTITCPIPPLSMNHNSAVFSNHPPPPSPVSCYLVPTPNFLNYLSLGPANQASTSDFFPILCNHS